MNSSIITTAEEITLPYKNEPQKMCTNQQHRQNLSLRPESKLFPKFILETSLSGSPENFRITLPAKPGLYDFINLNLQNSCPVKLDHLSIANLAMNWGKVGNLGQGLGYFFIGAGAGALSAGIGAGFGTLVAGSGSFGFMSATGLTAAGFLPGAAAGAGAGFTSGIVTGTGNSLMQGEKLKQSLGKGLQSGAWGLAIGGLTGGIQGGIRAHRFGNDFWSGGPTIHKKLDILWEKARLTGVIEPIDQAVGDVRIGRNSELEGALARARYGKTMPITEFREVNGLKYPKVATEQNDILFSRRLVRQMWRGAAPLEAINHEVIHTSDMFSAAYWNSPHFETLISDYSHTALNAWMEVRAYSVNVQRSNWPLFSLNLMRYQNILNLYGIQ